MSNSRAALPIGAVVERTGVTAATLRAWEERFGFPTPERLVGGHRRYSEEEVEQVEQVLAARRAGEPLERAIAAARGRGDPATSLFDAARRADPAGAVAVLSRRAMLALSRAVEDEACAQATTGLVLAAFQEPAAFARAEARWRDLARTVDVVVLARFPRPRRSGRLRQVALPVGSPLVREWSVVCDAPGRPACVVGREALGDHAGRRFEATWTVDPVAVRTVADAALALALPGEQIDRPPPDGGPPGTAARRAAAIAARALADLDRR